jgi:hypothetical protein
VTIELVPLATATVTLGDPFMLPETPVGTRVIGEVVDAVLEGERINARMKGRAAADWLSISAQLVGSVNVRMLFETDDGALVYVQYLGRMDLSAGPGAKPIYTSPLFETGDTRYTWLNTVQAVGKGYLDGTTLIYEIAEVR